MHRTTDTVQRRDRRPPTTSLRILVVDDDDMIGFLLAEVLEGMGHVVCGIEATEPGAVQAALRDKPDLMIVDAQLHGGSGIAAVATILESLAIPHIFMSGARLPAGHERAVKLEKPFLGRDLVNAIHCAISATQVVAS